MLPENSLRQISSGRKGQQFAFTLSCKPSPDELAQMETQLTQTGRTTSYVLTPIQNSETFYLVITVETIES